MYYHGQTSIPKEPSAEKINQEVYSPENIDNHKDNPDPILLTGSKIMTGLGRAVVCAVGKNTRLSKERTDDTLVIEGQQTYLEERLHILERQISKYATVGTMLIVLLQILHLTIRLLIM
jgi:Ca2+-transporting ATPase